MLTGGATYRFISFDSPAVGGSQEQHLGTFFLQNEWSVRENLTLLAGVGVDIHPQAGASPSPRASLVYSPREDHTFRVSIARAARNPSFLETFQSFAQGLPFPMPLIPIPPLPSPPVVIPLPTRFTILTVPNKDLDPEKSLAYEVGYQTLLFDRLRARIDLFYKRLDDLIDARPREAILFQPVPFLPPIQTGVVNQFINVGDGEIFGGEVGFDVLIASWLRGFLNYSYQERKGDVSLMGFASNHKANAGLTASFSTGLSATALVHYVGEPENRSAGVPPYTIFSLRLGHRFTVFGHEAEVSVQAFNLFNDVHREFPGSDFIERRVSGSIRYRF